MTELCVRSQGAEELLRSQGASEQNNVYAAQNGAKNKKSCMEFLGRLGLSRAQKFPQAKSCENSKQDFSLLEYGTTEEKRFVELNGPDENRE